MITDMTWRFKTRLIAEATLKVKATQGDTPLTWESKGEFEESHHHSLCPYALCYGSMTNWKKVGLYLLWNGCRAGISSKLQRDHYHFIRYAKIFVWVFQINGLKVRTLLPLLFSAHWHILVLLSRPFFVGLTNIWQGTPVSPDTTLIWSWLINTIYSFNACCGICQVVTEYK